MQDATGVDAAGGAAAREKGVLTSSHDEDFLER
jgi:hypothetical protein